MLCTENGHKKRASPKAGPESAGGGLVATTVLALIPALVERVHEAR